MAARLKTCTSSIWRLLKPLLDGLVGPEAELGVPQRAVGLGVTRVVERREVAEHVEQVAAVAQRVDQRRVAGAGVLGDVAVLGQVHEPLCLLVVGAGLAVDEAEQPLAGGAEEVVAAVVGRLVERRDVGRALEHRGQRLAGVGADVDDRLAGVEALDEQQVDPRLGVLARRGRPGDVDAEDAVTGVGVVVDVERAVAGGDDGGAVDGLRSGDADERAVAVPRRPRRAGTWPAGSRRGRVGDPRWG